jgi:signal transduction histidine kinase/DNA-binding response OmpR family regulator
MIVPTREPILIVISDRHVRHLLEQIIASMGFLTTISPTLANARERLGGLLPALLIVGEKLEDGDGMQLAGEVLEIAPGLPVIMFLQHETDERMLSCLRMGISDILTLPLRVEEIESSIQRAIEKARKRREAVLRETNKATASLQRRVDEMDTLTRLGRSITGLLDLDAVLSSIVDAAVGLTGSEEGSLMLLEEATGELYMRASRNFEEDFVRTFRLPVADTLAGTVMRTGQPILLDETTPKKIKTSYLVHNLIYVPIQMKGHVFGVLGVDNRRGHKPLKDRDVNLLTALAEYAVIAIENARLYTRIQFERNKYETVLTQIQDGVVVLDTELRLLFINQVARDLFAITREDILDKPFTEVFSHPELVELVNKKQLVSGARTEITTDDNRVFSTTATPIPSVGLALTLNDITYLKKLDQIKSKFVNTVSHDLRSPLTAILGYADLIRKVGPVTEKQELCIGRVQNGVRNITALVDDLLNLGRFEAGIDVRQESVNLNQIIRKVCEEFTQQVNEKKLSLKLDLGEGNPSIMSNPVQARQMVKNLLGNAVKYTPEGGSISVVLYVEQEQLILKITDTGIGIPTQDMAYIFDKFYRANNVEGSISGTGLGLAIVKAIVENHHGRIWVESALNVGTTFNIVLPVN